MQLWNSRILILTLNARMEKDVNARMERDVLKVSMVCSFYKQLTGNIASLVNHLFACLVPCLCAAGTGSYTCLILFLLLQDAVSCEEADGDYASVDDALPPGQLHRIRSTKSPSRFGPQGWCDQINRFHQYYKISCY